jgi:uncharacterized membrane protein YfcA
MSTFIFSRRSSLTVLRLAVFGLGAGFVNGLLGAGGGVLLVFCLAPFFHGKENGQRDIFANALAVTFPVSLVSAVSYATSGRFSLDGFAHYLIPCAIGGVFGAFLLGKLNVKILKTVFAVLVIFSGIYMVMR